MLFMWTFLKIKTFSDSRFLHGHRDAHNEDELEHLAGPSVDIGEHSSHEDAHLGL